MNVQKTLGVLAIAGSAMAYFGFGTHANVEGIHELKKKRDEISGVLNAAACENPRTQRESNNCQKGGYTISPNAYYLSKKPKNN